MPTSSEGVISIIVPILNEEKTIARTLGHLQDLDKGQEVIVVDGGSEDRSREEASPFAKVLTASRGRASQMNTGARHAKGDVLLFLHADTLLPSNAFSQIRKTLQDPRTVGGAFRIKLDKPGLFYGALSFFANQRARWLGTIYGDQAPFIRQEDFLALGGYRELEILEDADLMTRLRRRGKVRLLSAHVASSSRRWDRMGVGRTLIIMWAVTLGHLVGVSPRILKRLYPDVR